MMLTHCGNNVRNRYSGCVFSVKDIVPVPLKTSRNLFRSWTALDPRSAAQRERSGFQYSFLGEARINAI